MPSHLFSPSFCTEESVVLTRKKTHITGTVRRNVDVPVCVCVYVCERYKRSYIAHLVVHFSPVLILPFPLATSSGPFNCRELTKERKIKSAIRQKFPKVHITVLLSLIRQNEKYKMAERKKAYTQSPSFSITIVNFFFD